jgi:hypothetical protein
MRRLHIDVVPILRKTKLMGYSEIDMVIKVWVKRNKLYLLIGTDAEPNRIVHYSNSVPECYQISIEVPENECVNIRIRMIEGNDYFEICSSWRVSINNLELALNQIINRISNVGIV